jgi:hypothetical protein
MAQKPKPRADDPDKVKAEVKRRHSKALQERRYFETELREAYSFVMPYRVRPGYSQTTTPPGLEATDNFSSLGEEVCTDFSSDMADTFTPEHTQWASVEPAETVPDELKNDAAVAAKADSTATFASITASNFHETAKQSFKDLSVSAFGMSIRDPGAGQPMRCQGIPIGQLLILRDGEGNIGTRFWDRLPPLREIVDLFPDLEGKFSDNVKQAIRSEKWETPFGVVQGCYRDYSVRGEHAWISFTQIDGEVCESARVVGIGSAPILVGRWDPDPGHAWGVGPAIKALADFRELDETNYLKLKGLARNLDPVLLYDDDQVINLDGGLPNGVAIPRMKGSSVEIVESRHNMEAGFFAVDKMEDRIRRHFYQDGPIQKGLTPPTLGQWMDESLKKQRRLGTPAAPLWGEFLSEVYMRFRWLLVKRGTLKPLIEVGKQTFPVRPINPLQRAAQQQEALASERFLQSVAGTFGPNLLPVIVDVGETVTNLAKLSGASGVKLQPAASINSTIQQNQQALVAQQAAQAAGPLLKASGQ